MKLTLIERESALWKKIESELKHRLCVLRERNDGNLEALETSKIRGQIAQIKEILGWSEDLPNIN